MAAPATRESKPGSAARDAGDGQARNARRVTGPLAGAVLGPTVCGGCERGRWHRTTPTTGLFQRDGGWFGSGGGDFAAEEGLIEGIDAGREPSIQAVDAGVERHDIGAYFLAELDQVRADGFKWVRPPGRVVENGRSPPLVLCGGLRERQDHNLLRCRRRGRVSADTPTASPGTGVCRDPRNAIPGAFLRVVLAPIHAKFAREAFWGYWGTPEGENRQPWPQGSRK